ncbi:MAG: ATP-binding protein [Patescibacteria group bacterium]
MISLEELKIKNDWWGGNEFSIREAELSKREMFQKLEENLSHSLILNIIGLRRVGKSTMLKQLVDLLLKRDTKPTNIFYFLFDYASQIKTAEFLEEVLITYFNEVVKKTYTNLDERVYILLDEIQYIDNWQAVLKKFYDLSNKQIKFITTGSQSVLLKGKYRESLAGRIFDYYLTPLSFREFILINKESVRLLDKFDLFDLANTNIELVGYNIKHGGEVAALAREYMIAGQFPQSRELGSEEAKHEYIMESVIGKVLDDCIRIFNIDKSEEFKLITYQLIKNISSVFELKNIGQEIAVSQSTLEKYFEYLKESFIIDVLYKYHKSIIKRGRILKKLYIPCANFYPALNRYKERHIEEVPDAFGKLVENLVFNVLEQKYKDYALSSNVSFYRQGEKEIDFIVVKDRAILPIEVKFSNKTDNKNLKVLTDYVKSRQLNFGIVVTRNELNKKEVNGQVLYYIPYYLILMMI